METLPLPLPALGTAALGRASLRVRPLTTSHVRATSRRRRGGRFRRGGRRRVPERGPGDAG